MVGLADDIWRALPQDAERAALAGRIWRPDVEGPAVIEMRGTTVLVHPNNQVHMDRFGNIHIHLGASA